MKKISESLLFGARLICAVGAIVFSVFQILGVWDKANYVAIPLLGATLAVQAIQEWRNGRRGVAIFSLVAMIFVFVCTVAIILL